MIGSKKVKKHWPHDQALAMALAIVEEERCQQCGLPVWIAHSEDARIGFELDHIVCYSCEFEGVETGKSSYKSKKGHTPYVRPVLEEIEGEPNNWPTRSEHMRTQIRKAMKKAGIDPDLNEPAE